MMRKTAAAIAVAGSLLAGIAAATPALAQSRPERDDDIRPELADDPGHLVHQGREPGVSQGAVDVVQAADLADAEAPAGQPQLGLPDSGDGTPVTGGSVTDLARLAPGRRHHHDLGTLFRVAGERAPGAERLIIRMGEDTQQPAAATRRHAVIEQARPARRWLPDQAPSPGQVRCRAGPDRNRARHGRGRRPAYWSPQRPAAACPPAEPVAAAEPGDRSPR